jgi:putative ABC transport system permease protein
MSLALLQFLYRKILNTRWLSLSTLIGLIMAVAFTTSIPMYADGALKRVVASSLQANSQGFPAGSLLMRYQATPNIRAEVASIEGVRQFIGQEIPERIQFPVTTYVESLSIRGTQLQVVDPNVTDSSKRRQMTLSSMNRFEDYAELTNGVFPSQQIRNGIIEAVVLEEGAFRNYVRVGDEFWYSANDNRERLRIKVVGTYVPKEDTNPYWYQGQESLINTIIIDDTVMMDELLSRKGIPLHLAMWYYAFDLREIQTSQLDPLSNELSRLDIELFQLLKDTKVDISFQSLLQQFRVQSLQLQLLLFMLAAPMLAMVFYFISMNAKQSLDRQRTDIAVLRSRGASTAQMIWIFVLEGLLLGAIAILLGPMLGWFMGKSIGSASGFLTFVDRESIPIGFDQSTVWFALFAVGIALFSSVIPAIQFARTSIVKLKQQQARANRAPLWQRLFLDVALLLIVAYGWLLFRERQMISLQTGLQSDQIQIQPTLFFIPALAIFSLGLIFLRIFPLILRCLHWIGNRRFIRLPLASYLAITQLSRSSRSYYSIMLLLILTLGLGVYNSAAARTIDLNSTERTLYRYGTDVIIQSEWEGFAESSGPPQQNTRPNPSPNQTSRPTNMFYIEPPFEVFRELPGVTHAARVLQVRGNAIISGKSIGKGTIVGIDNVDFAKVAWWRSDLYPVHPYLYLDLLGKYEQAVIISSKIANQYQLKPGDLASISIQDKVIEFLVVGVLPYWPAQYPDESPFYIVNLEYIYDQIPIIPYEVWLKMEPGALVTPIIQQLQDQGMGLAYVKDVRNELIVQQKHPSRGGVFGILSLGFLVSIFVSWVGYLLYWFFNLSSRAVQFGVLRAMGLSRRGLTVMLLLEQAITAGLSILLGLGLGRAVSLLFLPFLQTTETAANQVPPFRVVFEQGDTLQLYGVVAIMVSLGGALLFTHIRRLRVHQAVKLGEER